MGDDTGPRILVWDCETTNLNASFGVLLAIAYKWVGKPKVYVPTILDYAKRNSMLDDKHLVSDFLDAYNQADYSVAHYGSKFDLPYINTKCLKHGLGPPSPIPLIDTCVVAWKNFKLHSNRLAAWLEYLDCKHEKKAMRTDDWLNAAHGCPKAMRAVKDRAKFDVLGLEEVFLQMRPWIKEPSRHLFVEQKVNLTCVACGSDHLQSRGWSVTKTRRYQRFQCQDCGKWQRETASDAEVKAALV